MNINIAIDIHIDYNVSFFVLIVILKLTSMSVLILNFRMFISNSHCCYVQSQNQDVYTSVISVVKEADTEANWDLQELAHFLEI